MQKISSVPLILFHTGRSIPLLGYGTYQLSGQQCYQGTLQALKIGYRHIDTASYYANQSQIKKAIATSGIARKQLFITSKLKPDQQGYDKAKKACDQILQKLGTNYLDLLLIHWPGTALYGAKDKRNAELRLETWRAMVEMKKEGKVMDIGVSNFLLHHLEHLVKNSEEKPVINQIELHPLLWEGPTIEFCQKNNIVVQAYSPLARNHPSLMKNELMNKIAEKYKKTVAQISIRWSIQNNFVSIPKSKTKKYIKENFEVLDFNLTADEMQSIKGLNNNTHTCWNPNDILY